MLRCALLLAFAGTVGALGSTQGLMRAREVAVARQELRQQLQRLLPQQQQDLGLLVPALKAGDRDGFKAHLTRMVHAGGNARIKKCLEGLSVVGFDATELQAWLQSASAPVPQSNILKTRAEKAQLEAKKKMQAQNQQQEQVQVEKNKRSAPEQAKPKPQSQPAEQKKDQTAAHLKPHPNLKPQPGSSKTGFVSDQKITAVKHEQVHESKHADAGKQQVKEQHAQAEKQVAVQKQKQEHKEVEVVDKSTTVTKKDQSSVVRHDIEQKVQQEKSQHVEKQEQKKTLDMSKVGMAKETKKHRRIGMHGSLRKRTDAELKSLPAVSAMAGSTEEQQHVSSAQGKVHEDLKKADSDKRKADKQKKKAALRQELSKRLAKGVQALSRVRSLEKEEADLKSTMSASEARINRIEEALAEEVKARKKVEKENEELKAEVLEEEKKSKTEAARLEAIENHELDAPKDTAARIEVLEAENGKFHSALAGAARRIINIESQVAGKDTGKVKVIRHDKHSAEPAL